MPPAEYSKYSLIELSVLAISDIIQELLKAHESGKDLNLNKTKTQISSKYGLPSTPKVCQQAFQEYVGILFISPISSWLTSSLQYPLNTGKYWFPN